MFLYEEYLNRCSIQTKFIGIVPNSYIFLKSSKIDGVYKLIQCHKRLSSTEPCSFNFKIHNFVFNKQGFDFTCNDTVHWDNYHQYMLNLISQLKGELFVVILKEKLLINAWKAFLTTVDELLADIMDLKLFKIIDESLQPKVTDEQLTYLIKECANLIYEKKPNVSDLWVYYFSSLSNIEVKDWLVKLINEQ